MDRDNNNTCTIYILKKVMIDVDRVSIIDQSQTNGKHTNKKHKFYKKTTHQKSRSPPYQKITAFYG